MATDWEGLRGRLQAAAADPHRRVFFSALLRRGEIAEAQGQAAVALHCRGRVESFLARTPAIESAPRAAVSVSPLDVLKNRWEQASRSRAELLLQRQGRRLTSAEREAFTAWIPAAPSENLPALRRRLLDRLLRILVRRRTGPPALPKLDPDAGPYNAQATLTAVLARTADADPDWMRDWMDLYGRMEKLRRLYTSLRPAG